MAATIKSYITQTAAEEGYVVRKFSDADANDMIAADFQSRVIDFLAEYAGQVIPQYGTKLRIYFRFVEKSGNENVMKNVHGLDAWTTPFFSGSDQNFIICISMNMLRGISDVFTAMAVGPQGLLVGVTEKDIEQKFDEIYPRIGAALTFIFLHELSHIIRAHIPFLFLKEYKRKATEGLSFHLVESRQPKIKKHRKLSFTRSHRAMEIDADQLAVGLIHEFVSNETTKAAFIYDGLSMNDPVVFGEAIAVVTRLLEQWRRSVSGSRYNRDRTLHPHPDIRYIFMQSWLLARQKLQDKSEAFVKTTKAFEKGFENVTKKMETFGNQFFPLFEYLETRGKNSSLDEYEVCRVDLEQYIRPALSEFRLKKH